MKEVLGEQIPVDIPRNSPAENGNRAHALSRDEEDLQAEIEKLLRRRPCTLTEVAVGNNIPQSRARQLLRQLGREGRITTAEHNGTTFFQVP